MSVRIVIRSVLAVATDGTRLEFTPDAIESMARGETVSAIRAGKSVRVAALDTSTLSVLGDSPEDFRTFADMERDETEHDFVDPIDSIRARVENGPNGPRLIATGDGIEESADISYSDAAEFEAGREIEQSRYGVLYGISASGVRELD